MMQTSASAQAVANGDEIRKGHHLAVMLCADCHVVASDQTYATDLKSSRAVFCLDSPTHRHNGKVLTCKTHHGLDNPKSMSAPMLADFQIAAITAYRSICESNPKRGCDRFIGIEYYADYGKIGNVLPLPKQSQQLYAVTDFKVKDVEAEFGAGYGFTPDRTC